MCSAHLKIFPKTSAWQAEILGATATFVQVVWVPGTYEAPLVVRKMLERKDIDCVVVVGYIEKVRAP